jgi:hypothetical protein
VVELTAEGDLLIIDGTHRVYSAFSRDLENIEVFLVKNASTPPPATPLSDWDAIKVATEKYPRNLRYTDYRQDNFRPIRNAVSALAGFPSGLHRPSHGHA